MMNKIKFAYFGGEPLGVPVLEELKKANLLPTLIVCNPDRPSGRGHKLTPPPVKVWAEENDIAVFQPASYKDPATRERLESEAWDVFVVVAYNFILPEWFLHLPKQDTLNVHPSLLPKLRGASPIRTAILKDLREDIGVTVMLLDTEMDHGPILDQEQLPVTKENWPVPGPELDRTLATLGGELLAEILPAWVAGELSPQEQDHAAATYCSRFEKGQNEIGLDPKDLPHGRDAWETWLKINAFAGIGDTYFTHNNQRVKIKQAAFTNDALHILRVIPEGKKEIDFSDFLKSL